MTSSSETSRLSGRPAWAFDRRIFLNGMRDGVPIALGYFAVSFSLGIAARNAGLTPLQGFFASLLNNASAGEYAAFTLIAANATLFQVALITLIANARYLLMSCALAQRFAPGTPFFHRLIIAYDVTDELFGITISRPGCRIHSIPMVRFCLPLLHGRSAQPSASWQETRFRCALSVRSASPFTACSSQSSSPRHGKIKSLLS